MEVPADMMRLVASLLALTLVLGACASADDDTLTIYSGRGEELVGPVIERFEEETGITVEVRYGDSAELAATLLAEGEDSPADVFFAQDPASLGSVAAAGLFERLDDDILSLVDPRFSDAGGEWIGISGRVRVVAYDTSQVDPSTFPADEDGFTDGAWANRVAIAPTNGSFLTFVAAKIVLDGEEATLAWLEGMAANNAPTYPKNSAIIAAIDEGQVEAGLVNHYYRMRFAAESPDTVVANHFFDSESAGGLVMPAGVGVIGSSDAAVQFVEYLLSEESQRYFAETTFEYPLIGAVEADPGLTPLSELPQPDFDLSDLAGLLDRATELVAEAGLL
jgi:iron(III) transport system substrate-binding protein